MHLDEFENTWVCSSSKNWQGAGFLSQYDIDKHVINRLICVNHGKDWERIHKLLRKKVYGSNSIEPNFKEVYQVVMLRKWRG